MNRSMNNKNPKIFVYLISGFLLGLVIRLKFSSSYQALSKCHDKVILDQKEQSKSGRSINIEKPVTVKAKPNRFNNDYRPYFVYSELGFKNLMFVGVKISEQQLMTNGVTINNTWSSDDQTVVFFTPYSRDSEFHNRFVKKLNLNVIQLPDIVDTSSDLEFSLRIVQYMKDHHLNKYNWFILSNVNVYLNIVNAGDHLKRLNSTQPIILANKIKGECSSSHGVIMSHTALSNYYQTDGAGFPSGLLSKLGNKETLFCNSERFLNIQSSNMQRVLGDGNTLNVISIAPLKSNTDMLKLHKTIVQERLKETLKTSRNLQASIKEFHDRVPNDVLEKKLTWPLGYPRPFRPSSRFEVIQWTLFDKNKMYAFTDQEPTSSFPASYYGDFTEILQTVKQAINQKYGNRRLELLNGYHRVDPKRGAEYLIEMKDKSSDKVYRYQLLRPFSRVESLSMPAATEQKGIHIVLPLLKDDMKYFEKFMQMYKRLCLQSGENVVLLTVFVNIRDGKFEEEKEPFLEFKNLISRYKQSYMWAQLPWLQVGVKHISDVLVMDIVSMKLPSNALILLLSHHNHFTVNFLNRCRVNVVTGLQVFFPIPFLEYNPDIVYNGKQKPAFSEVHTTTGFWGRDSYQVGCFNNNDYKAARMWKNDFLDENLPNNKTILGVFEGSNLNVFRALDSELHTWYEFENCVSDAKTNKTGCHFKNSQRLGNRAQLAQVFFDFNNSKKP
eukprot:TCONS_00068795-protein